MLASALKGIEGPHEAEQRHKRLPAFRDKSGRVPLSVRPPLTIVWNTQALLKENLCVISSFSF